MIDDTDADLAFIYIGGPIGIIVGIILILIAMQNAEDCERRTCPTGEPKLLDHECVCVSAPEPRR